MFTSKIINLAILNLLIICLSLRNRDIRDLKVSDLNSEMKYTQGSGILRVTMEADKKPELPTLDLYILQVQSLIRGKKYFTESLV